MAITHPTAPSDKQLAYIDTLVDRACNGMIVRRGAIERENFMHALFAVAMPAPTTSLEASERIEDLKAFYGPVRYARAHEDWAQGIIVKFVGRYGPDGTGLPTIGETAHTHADGTLRGCYTIGDIPICERTTRQWIEEVLA